jgi:hypothetical protein
MLSSFEELARQVTPEVGGLPGQVQLVDSRGDVEETSTVGEVGFDGGDGVYYDGRQPRLRRRHSVDGSNRWASFGVREPTYS